MTRTHRTPAARHPAALRRRPLALALALLFAPLPPCLAGVQTDGSTGAVQTLVGPNFVIPQTLGTVAGNNLFHSFQTFGIAGGESATFQTTVTGNVISRVTGGAASLINGPITLTAGGGGTPAFWFINPAGVVFGAGASINVPGAFHVSTADYVRFADGTRFYATLGGASTFSAAAPESFGFLGTQRATLAVQDGAVLQNVDQQITLVAGDVLIDNAEVRTRGGDIRIVALGQRAATVATSGALPYAEGALDIVNDAIVQSLADTAADGGNVAVAAGDTYVDFSILRARSSDSGNSGTLRVETGNLIVTADSRLGSRADAAGNAGDVTVLARGDVWVEWASAVTSNTLDTGNAGNVTVEAGGAVNVLGAGTWISSDTFADGHAGSVTVRAASLYVDAYGGESGISSEAVNGATAGNAGAVSVTVGGATELRDGGRISSATYGSGYAGWVSLNSGSLLIDGTLAGAGLTGVLSNAQTGSSGDAGAVWVNVSGGATLSNGGVISSSSQGLGAPGWVDMRAGSLLLTGSNGTNASAISSDAAAVSGGFYTGYVAVNVSGAIALSDGASISTNSLGALDAGYIDVRAGGAVTLSNGAFIASDANDTGAAGNVSLRAGRLTMSGATYISSDALGDGDAGSVSITVGNAVSMSNSSISSDTYGLGQGGNVSLSAGSLSMNQAYITSDTAGDGNAGSVYVQVAGQTTLRNSAWISSDTYATGDAGTVTVRSGSLLIDGQGSATGISSEALVGSSGNAGLVSVEVAGAATLKAGGQISSSTYDWGNAGVVEVSTGSLTVDGTGSGGTATGVITTADVGAGDAGYVIVESPGSVLVKNGGQISSSTYSASGAAGVVLVVARDVTVDGAGSAIAARAEAGSSGQTGYVAVVPSDVYGWTTLPIATETITVSNGGEITIANHATGAVAGTPGFINLQANDIRILNASVTANSTGTFPASDIYITFSNILFVDPSQISTSSNDGDGGNIVIQGGRGIFLDRSQITTSVSSLTNGNGGDISISADVLALNNGFIQANTNAPASGGDIAINVSALIPSYNSLLIGGAIPLAFDPVTPGFNVIQSAAPGGISGDITVSSPPLDLSGSLAGVKAQVLQGGGLGRSPCDTTAGSSLAAVGRGGLPPLARDALRVETAAAPPPARAAESKERLVLAMAGHQECAIQ